MKRKRNVHHIIRWDYIIVKGCLPILAILLLPLLGLLFAFLNSYLQK